MRFCKDPISWKTDVLKFQILKDFFVVLIIELHIINEKNSSNIEAIKKSLRK